MKGWSVRSHLVLLLASLGACQRTAGESALYRQAVALQAAGAFPRATMKARAAFRSILLRTARIDAR